MPRDRSTAMHRQLAQQLRQAIAGGGYRPGERLPTEPQLAARHAVSRVTAHQAVMQLVREGLVVRRQGKGFVAEPPVHHDLVDLRGIYDELVARGVNPTTELLDYAELVPPANVVERLHSGARKVLHYKRLYLRRGEPFAVGWAWLAPSIPKVSRELVAAHTTYQLFDSVLHLKIRHADLSVRALAASPELRKLLRLRAHAPIIALERVSYLADGKPAEFTLYCANAENYAFALRIRGKVPITSTMRALP
ncbi:MAG TPA: GntR family transcriptional regulator [Burkholderiales bacterium]|nr:GntR family transcriptional regulator [Burkholderiales bacterium]